MVAGKLRIKQKRNKLDGQVGGSSDSHRLGARKPYDCEGINQLQNYMLSPMLVEVASQY